MVGFIDTSPTTNQLPACGLKSDISKRESFFSWAKAPKEKRKQRRKCVFFIREF
jgi:hypothetical protein